SLSQTADQADWLIGADVFSPGIQGDALRSLKSPGNAYNDPTIGRDPQPSHMDNFQQLPDTEEGDWGGVHINSGIPNHAFFLVATSLGGNAWEEAGHIWYEALKSSGPFTDFQQFAERTYDFAGRLYGTASAQQQAVRAAWRDVGIRISAFMPAPLPGARAGQGATATDTQAVLLKQLAALAKEVQTLSHEVAQLKKSNAYVST
ncbi:MAG: M4 family metallopeptidase, partial [Candidatus Tectomicrobia bacterium]|nr:M4 family metallopeptidase [Candidatus Tectomicrobia bacterium]